MKLFDMLLDFIKQCGYRPRIGADASHYERQLSLAYRDIVINYVENGEHPFVPPLWYHGTSWEADTALLSTTPTKQQYDSRIKALTHIQEWCNIAFKIGQPLPSTEQHALKIDGVSKDCASNIVRVSRLIGNMANGQFSEEWICPAEKIVNAFMNPRDDKKLHIGKFILSRLHKGVASYPDRARRRRISRVARNLRIK